MTLRCKTGDIAIIVFTNPALDGALGRVVERLQPVYFDNKDCWRLKERVSTTVLRDCMSPLRETFRAGDAIWFDVVPDSWLRPLRGDEGQDETLTWVGKPSEVPNEVLAPKQRREFVR